MIPQAIFLSLGLLCALPQPREDKYAVVVNTNNACKLGKSEAQALIKKLFLKQLTDWPDGTKAKPFGRDHGEAALTAFVKEVVGMNDAELARHWLKLKNQNGTTPPKEVKSDRMLLKYIGKYDGAFGVVSLDEAQKDGSVKVLFSF